MNGTRSPFTYMMRVDRRPAASRSLPLHVMAISLLAVTLTGAAAQSQSTPATPDAPAPAASTAAAPLPLAQQMQQAQREAYAPQRPFHVDLPRSHNPLSPYMPSEAPPLDLANSPRLGNLVRDGKLYISLHDAVALAIENISTWRTSAITFPLRRPTTRAPKPAAA